MFLGDWGGRGSGRSGRVRAVASGGLQRGQQELDFRLLGSHGGGKLVKCYTTGCGFQGEVVGVVIKLCHHLFRGERHGGLSTSRGMGEHRGGDVVGVHGKVGGAEGVATLRRGAKFHLHFTV